MKTRNKEHLLSESLVDAVKEGSILADVMLGRAYFTTSDSFSPRKDKLYKTSADKQIKNCPVCNLTWENVRGSQSEFRRTIYYKNIPRFGKKIIICDRCSEEEE
tara:strand:+ start:852 stop:1163 length:312 start_codon:yes stop_codon:yes gene_type:complete